MADSKGSIDEMIDSLKRLRDELRLKIHLGSKEAQDQYDALEQKWDQMMKDSQPVKDAVSDTARGVGAAAELAADELKSGYEKIRDLLK
jgi:hypothetical protein